MVIKSYRLSWDPSRQCGEATLILDGGSRVTVPVFSPDQINVMAMMLKSPNAVWDDGVIRCDFAHGAPPLPESELEVADKDAGSKDDKVTKACKEKWPSFKDDCSGFVVAVAGELCVSLSGQANHIVDQITGADWTKEADGKAAKEAADQGKLVVGGLRGKELSPPEDNGHVVIVVSGPLAQDKYPTAYWGKLNGEGKAGATVNWAFRKAVLDKVHYASIETG